MNVIKTYFYHFVFDQLDFENFCYYFDFSYLYSIKIINCLRGLICPTLLYDLKSQSDQNNQSALLRKCFLKSTYLDLIIKYY